MLYIMIFGAIFAFAYFFFWESSFELFKKNKATIQQLKTKIKIEKLYLKINSLQKINKIKQNILKIDNEIIHYKKNNAYIKHKIETISSLIYDEISWSDYINSISKNAKKYDVKILNFSNTIVENQGEFGHILDISIQSQATFKNTLRFINALEQNKLVVDIHNLQLTYKDDVQSDLNLSVWGIK